MLGTCTDTSIYGIKSSSKFKMSFNFPITENLSDLVSFLSSNTQESLTQGP